MAPAKRLMLTGLAITNGIFASAQAKMKGCSSLPVASITTRVTVCFFNSFLVVGYGEIDI